MHTVKDLAERAARDLEASSRTSRTEAGRAESPRGGTSDELIDAINQVFALFRLNYHNQYYSAFGDGDQLNQIKKLWLDSLLDYSPATILVAAKRCIHSSEYLPTLHRMLDCCSETLRSEHGLPDAHAAYLEACRAGEPRELQRWSHPAVYLAARECGWGFLASAREKTAYALFERHYGEICRRVLGGERLELPAPQSSSTAPETESFDKRRERLRQLRREAEI